MSQPYIPPRKSRTMPGQRGRRSNVRLETPLPLHQTTHKKAKRFYFKVTRDKESENGRDDDHHCRAACVQTLGLGAPLPASLGHLRGTWLHALETGCPAVLHGHSNLRFVKRHIYDRVEGVIDPSGAQARACMCDGLSDPRCCYGTDFLYMDVCICVRIYV